MLSLVLWLQQQSHGLSMTGDEFRTAMIGALLAVVGYIARQAGAVRDDVRDMKRDLHGVDGKNGMKGDVRLLVQRVDAIEDRNIAIDAVVKAEQAAWPFPDRRLGARRLQDVIREAAEERSRQITDEHPRKDE